MISTAGPGSSAPLRIFVVENHVDTLRWLSRYLEMLGHTVLSARTRAEALKVLPTADCDVLISDIGLPDGDGWDLLKLAKVQRPLYGIAMSGFGTPADLAKSEAAGYRHHILKPFDPNALEHILHEAANAPGHVPEGARGN